MTPRRPPLPPGGTAGEYLVVRQGDDNTGGLVDEEFETFGKMMASCPSPTASSPATPRHGPRRCREGHSLIFVE